MEEIDFEQLYELGILSDDVYSWVVSSKREIATLQAEIDAKNKFIQATRPELAKKITTLQAEIDEYRKAQE